MKVIGTCSLDKTAWVAANLHLDPACILDSHSLSFRDKVLLLTHGEGVDVVLNSLSDEKLQASLSLVAKYGHFCEIGKYDIQQNNPIGLNVFDRNVSFHGIDLSDMFYRPKVWYPIYALVKEGLVSGEIKPLCTTVFTEIEPALRYISTGKHVGKVLVQVESNTLITDALVASKSLSTFTNRYFVTTGTHLVVGGLGGFGLEFVDFLFHRGATKIIIISRGSPQVHMTTLLHSAVVQKIDLLNAFACDELIATLGVELIGVWHLGMVLNDKLYENMNEESWSSTVNVKRVITFNLDQATRKYCPALQHFVVWSSVTALFGNPGQTNYAYGNASMEQVCYERQQDMLPGLAIQWGLIGGVGVMMDKNTSFSFAPQHIDNCLEAMNTILFCDKQAVLTCYLRKLNVVMTKNKDGVFSIPERIARVLGLDILKIRESDTLSALGMDSLQSVEIYSVLKSAGIVSISSSDLKSTCWSVLAKL